MSDDDGMRTDGDQRRSSARGSIGKNRNFCPNKQLNLLETIGVGGSWEWEREEGAGEAEEDSAPLQFHFYSLPPQYFILLQWPDSKFPMPSSFKTKQIQ